MSGARALPYLRSEANRVRCSRWHLGSLDQGQRMADALPDWDPTTPLALRQRVRVNVPGVRADCGLRPDDRLRLVAAWKADGTYLRGASAPVELPVEGEIEVDLALDLVGADLGGSIHLSTAVVLAAARPREPLRASLPGAVLWESTATLRLEGGESRFPMEAVPFSKAGWDLPPGAAWRLELDPTDLELPALGSLRLLLNSEHLAIRRVLDTPQDPRAKLTEAAMRFDVARTLIMTAITLPDYAARGAEPWPRDSVGAVIEKLLKAHFKRETVATLAQLQSQDPGRFEALLQDRLHLLKGV